MTQNKSARTAEGFRRLPEFGFLIASEFEGVRGLHTTPSHVESGPSELYHPFKRAVGFCNSTRGLQIREMTAGSEVKAATAMSFLANPWPIPGVI